MMNKRILCGRRNALIHESGHFMTVLKEWVFSLVYYSAVSILHVR